MPALSKLIINCLVVLLLATSCTGADDNDQVEREPSAGNNETVLENTGPDDSAHFIPAVQGGESDSPVAREGATPAGAQAGSGEAFDAWLQKIRHGEIETVKMDADLEWGLGYFLYYASLDSIQALGIDNIIYHALEAHRRLDTGEVTEETISQNDKNLLAITAGLRYDSNRPLVEQVAQTAEIRAAILEHIVENQRDLSPQEAIASDNMIGVFGPPAAAAIGGKYLVYTQASPGADFEFLGVIMAVDAAGQGHRETYSGNGWNDLAWLGDAAGPFWDDLPAGISGDPANKGEARPGVFLVSETTYAQVTAGNVE